ncbi:MAG: hypothetical protein Q7T25_14560, partial [Sideroxyarcus sp.]|nr:hypothetical protein [Sideroxyarcus sp.]
FIGTPGVIRPLNWHVSAWTINGTALNAYDDQSPKPGNVMSPLAGSPRTLGGRDGAITEPAAISATSQPCCGADQSFTGYISEIIIYNRVLNAAEKTAIESYIQNKYFTLPTTLLSNTDPNLRLWLKADAGVTTPSPSDNNVTEWKSVDKYQTSMQPRVGVDNKPKRINATINGTRNIPVVKFIYDGTPGATYMTRLFQTNNMPYAPSGIDPLDIGAGTPVTAFVVYKPSLTDTDGLPNQCIFAKRGASSCVYQLGMNAGTGAGQLNFISYDAITGYYAGNQGMSGHQWHVSALNVYDKAYFGQYVNWFDDESQSVSSLMWLTPGSRQTIAGRNASTPEPFGIAGHSQPCCGNGEPYTGDIAEIIIFARHVSGAERDGIDQYLRTKYFTTPSAIDPCDP